MSRLRALAESNQLRLDPSPTRGSWRLFDFDGGPVSNEETGSADFTPDEAITFLRALKPRRS